MDAILQRDRKTNWLTAYTFRIDQNLIQWHHAVFLRQHGFLGCSESVQLYS